VYELKENGGYGSLKKIKADRAGRLYLIINQHPPYMVAELF